MTSIIADWDGFLEVPLMFMVMALVKLQLRCYYKKLKRFRVSRSHRDGFIYTRLKPTLLNERSTFEILFGP